MTEGERLSSVGRRRYFGGKKKLANQRRDFVAAWMVLKKNERGPGKRGAKC